MESSTPASPPGSDLPQRCRWATGTTTEMQAYHDLEWGVPLHDENALFELLTLEGAQAGLSWSTVLAKREGYRKAFAGFDVERIAAWPDARVDELVGNAGIIRNRAKIASVLGNARAARDLRASGTTLDQHLWSFVGAVPLQPALTGMGDMPAFTELSETISRDLKRRGWRFVGPTIVYAFMQSAGMTNDHTVDCFRYRQLGGPTPAAGA
jgi:DNA-3-methyladenine glycosylase I